MLTDKIKLYENREDVTLSAYIISDSNEMLKGKKRPAVIICPGGAYMYCSDTEGEPVALRFAAMGYHTFVLRYSTYGEGKMDFFDTTKELECANPNCKHPAPMRDIGKAMLIIRENASQWLIDMDKIALCGFSAGAHNCSMYATNWHTPILSEYFHEEPTIFRPAATILGYTLSDYIYMKDTTVSMSKEEKVLFHSSNLAFLGTKEPDDSLLDEVSPTRHVTKNTPPMFIWATAEDSLVPVQHSIRLANALADNKIPFEVHIFENGPHGLSISTQASAEAKSQIYPDAAKWVGLAESWLEKRFSLPLSERTAYEEMILLNEQKV